MQINVAFCFDHNLMNQAQVTAASLLDFARVDHVHYHIYCVCTKEAAQVEHKLRQIVAARDKESELTMKVMDNPYEGAYEVRGISAGTYLRLAFCIRMWTFFSRTVWKSYGRRRWRENSWRR